MAKGPLFLNTPISSVDQDAVGVNLFVEKLNTAIDSGAQMVAIASPFGAGKSSVVEVLQHTRKKRAWWKLWQRKDVFIEVSMWSHLNNQKFSGSTAELHKNFIYQMASQIKPRKGTYVSRRLSQNYGLLRLHANKRANWFLMTIALLLFAAQWFLTNYSETSISWIPWLEGKTGWMAAAMLFCATVIAIVILTTTDIIFSSNKSEGTRTIDSDEIMDLYRMELLKPRYNRLRLWKWLRHGIRYIVIIEDLDRTDDPETVLSFLKELRKYYVPEKDVAATYVNQINFIVTIKPEALLVTKAGAKTKQTEEILRGEDSEQKENEKVQNAERGRESLYAKIFDYTLTLQTINMANYDAVLHELLKGHRNELKVLGAFGNIDIEKEENLANLPGMEWIICEERIGVREIKERLNIAFTMFETLKNRFQNVGITFERCAAAAYLMTAFEEDFHATTDSAFQELVDYYLHLPQRDEKAFSDVANKFAQYLGGTSEEYQRAVWDLIRSKKIESSYRMYYYNYPRASVFYTAHEALVNSAIMLGETVDGLETAAQAVTSAHSKVIRETYQKLKQLGMPLPVFVFEIEPLYVEAVRYNFDEVLRQVANFDYSTEGTQKTVARIKSMLSFDQIRDAYNRECAGSFCKLWAKKMSEPTLLQLRLMLCQTFPHEILWYQALFGDKHRMASMPELEMVPFCYALELIDQENTDFSGKTVDYVVSRYVERLDLSERKKMQNAMEAFLRSATMKLGVGHTALALIEFMKVNGEIIDDFDEEVCTYIKQPEEKVPPKARDEADEEPEDIAEEDDEDKILTSGESVFFAYQELINQIAPSGLKPESLQRLRNLERYDGFTPETAMRLKENNYIYEYVLLALCQGQEIMYGEQDIMQAILENKEHLYRHDRELFLQLRTNILESDSKNLGQYSTLFGETYPIITERELEAVGGERHDFDLRILDVTPPKQVTTVDAEHLCKFFCRDNFRRKERKNEVILTILCFVGKMESKAANTLFYGLDFNIITYKNLSREKRDKAKEALRKALELDIATNQVSFMKATRTIDAEWEAKLVPLMKEDPALEKAYVDAVNSCEKVSPNTVAVITKLSVIYGTAPHITTKVLQEKRFFWYVASKIQWDKEFIMEEGNNAEALWNAYVEIYGKERDDSWGEIKAWMTANTAFLSKLMERNEFAKLDDESRISMARLLQDARSVEEAFSRGDEFALSYFLKVGGFRDKAAADKFVNLVIANEKLLASNELYEHIHEKLVDGTLKARYTYRRNRQVGK